MPFGCLGIGMPKIMYYCVYVIMLLCLLAHRKGAKYIHKDDGARSVAHFHRNTLFIIPLRECMPIFAAMYITFRFDSVSMFIYPMMDGFIIGDNLMFAFTSAPSILLRPPSSIVIITLCVLLVGVCVCTCIKAQAVPPRDQETRGLTVRAACC